MHRDDSLSEMMGERGRGLADLKGWDPLDRRIEVEKKEKYGQALRDQMAMNSARGSPSRAGETTATSPLPPSRPSSCTRAGEVIASPGSMMHGSVVTDSSPASKVAQVQQLMRQRLQAVQEEQQRQWQEVQHALNSQLHAAREAAEEAVRLQFGELISGQGAELQAMRKALSDIMAAQKHTEEQSGRHVDALAGELADARMAVQRLEAESGAWQSQLQGLRGMVDELARAKQEHSAQQDAAQRDLADARSAMQRLQLQSDDLLNRMQSQAQEMERLRIEKQDSASAHAECARDRASLAQRLQEVENGLNDARHQLREHGIEIDRLKVAHQECASARMEMQRQFQQLRDDQGRLGSQISEVQGAVSRLRHEVPQLAEAAARRLVDGLPRPVTPPVSAPPPPPLDPMPDVSENAYAVLRGAEGELFELPGLENVIGRSTACDTCIPGSQAISNRHMCISFASDGTASIRDIGSRNGTFLNDHRVAATALVMKSGDKVQLGVDGPSYVFTWGPAYYARWPRELQRASGARDLMERTSLAEALDKLNSDVVAQHAAGLDALKTWLQDPMNLEKADDDPEVWPAVLKMLDKYGKRQLDTVLGRGGRKGTFKVDGPAVLHQVLHHLRNRKRKAPPGEKMMKAQLCIWSHITESLRNETLAAKQPEALFYFCKAAAELSEAAEHGALPRGRDLKTVLKVLLEVPSGYSQNAQGAALNAAASLCRYVDGDIVAEVPLICERSLALMQSCGQAAANCLGACALRAPFAFRDWVACHLETFVGRMISYWPLRQNIDQLELAMRLALNLGLDLPKREAQTLLPLVVETLEQHALADSAVERSRFRGEKTDHQRSLLRARMADLLAALLWQATGSAADAASELCVQLERRCLPWALCLVRLVERFHLDHEQLAPLMAAVLRQLQKARLEMEPALQGALAALLNAHGWLRLMAAPRPLPVWCSLLCPEMPCLLCSPGIVENLPALDRYECSPELAQQFNAAVDYVRAWWAQRPAPMESHFWHLAAMVFLMAVDTKDLEEKLWAQLSTKSSSGANAANASALLCAARQGSPLRAELQRKVLEVLLTESFEHQWAFMRIASTPQLPDLPEAANAVSTDWTLEMNDFYLAVPLRDAMPQAAVEGRQRRCGWFEFEGVLQRRLAMAALDETSRSQGLGAGGQGAEVDEVLLHRYALAAQLQAPAAWRQRRPSAEPVGPVNSGGASSAAFAVFISRFDAFKDAQDPSREMDQQQLLRAAASLLPSFGLAISACSGSAGNQRMLTDCFRRTLQFACSLTSSQARNNDIDVFFASLCTLLWQVAHSGVLASSDYQSLVATLAENIASAPLGPAVALAVLMALTALQDTCCRALRQQLQSRKEEEPYAVLTAIRFAATEICWQLNRADATFGQGAKAVPAIMEVVEAWCSCLLPISALEWELFFSSIQRILLILEKSETEDVKRRLMQRLWGKAERGSPSRLQVQVEALANSFHPNGRCKIALASVLTTSLRLLRPQEEVVKAAADCCMSWVPDFILKDPCREVQLEVSNSCISSLFECFDSTAVFDELRPVLDFSSETLVSGENLPNSCALVAFQVAIAISCCQGYMHRVLPAFCASPPAVLRPLARKALKVLDEELGLASVDDLSPLALTFRAPIFQTLLKVKGASLTQVPLVDLGLADTTPARPGKGQRWGFGRHLAAAVCAMVLAEDVDQVSDLAPCCGMGPKSPEFLELLLVPLAACVIPLRKSLERLHQRFGEQQVVKLLKSKASHIFAFALQLPFLTFGSPHAVDAETIAAAFREVAPQVDWLDTSAFVSKHFRELLFLLDPVIRAWSSHLPQTTLSLWRSLIAWVGPLSGSRLRLVLAMMQQGDLPPKQRVELSRIVADAIAAAAAHKSNGLVKLVRHRDETLQLMLSSVEQEWSSSPPEAVRGESSVAERSPALTALLALLKALKAEEGVLWLQLQLEAILPRLVPEAQKLLAAAAQLELPDGPRSAKRLRRGASARLAPEDALKQLAPLAPDLSWGPPSSPDVGCIVRCLPEKSNDAAEEVMYASLRLLAQGSPAQLRNDPHLARALAMGLASLKPVAMKALSETSSDKLEGALGDTKYQVDDLLYSVALLGASHLQAHRSAALRQLSGRALRHLMATQKGWCHSARNTLKNLLNKVHLACEDLDELSHLVATSWSSIPAGSNVGRTISWQFTRQEADISSWMSGVLSHLLKLGSSVWDGSGTAVLTACAPLAKHSLWFSQRLLVLLLVKAANMPKSGSSLAKDLTGFFKQVASTSRQQPQARCLLHALHLIRVHQRAQKKRAVPHFPDDSEDPFWSSLDLFAAASCAASISDSQNAFLLLELHLQRSKPDLPLQEALESVSSRGLGVEALFQPPAKEIDLLHALARQLPDDELLYGQGEWCHASSRLARAELAQDNFTSIHLRIDLLESALQRNDVAGLVEARHGMDAAISRLGWHSLLTKGVPEDDVAWEKRAEALWRLRQWGPIEGMKQGFHSSVHSALSGLSSAVRTVESHLGTPAASHDFSQAVTALERPLWRTVAEVVNEIQVQLPEELQQKALQLQMLGSIFQCCDALVSDVHQKTQNGPTRSVLNLASSWTSNVPVSARSFNHVEPLLALQSSLLATTSHPLAEGRFLIASAAAARAADLAQRGLSLLERAQGANAKVQRQENLMLRWEQARCLYALKSPEGMSIAKALAAECRQGIQGQGIQGQGRGSSWAAQVLSCTGLWLSESRLENADVIKKDYFEASALLDPDPGSRNGRQFAEFLDNKLTEELAFQGSAGHQRTLRSRQLTEQKIQRIDEDVAKVQRKGNTAAVQKEVKDLQEQKGKLEKHRRDDLKDGQQEKERLKTLTLGCVKQLGQCLAAQDGQGGGLTQVACRFLSLWFDHNLEFDEITNIVKDAIPTLSLDAVLPFIYQLAARLEMKDTAFQRTLDELLLRLAQKGSPALWPLISLRNGATVPKDFANGQSSFRADTSKVDAATRVTSKCRNSQTVRPVLEAVESLSRFYLAVAFHDVGMNSKDPRVRHVRIAFEKVKHFREAKQVVQSCRVPVPTAASTLAYIQQFEGEITIAPQGISIPKIVWARDSEGRRHKQLVKGNDDLRQDAVMQQLFGLLNVVFKEDPKSLSLRLRTFQVVPLSPQAGIVEWVQETETLGEILVGSSNTDGGAHQRYRPQDWDQSACRKRLGDAKELGHAQKLQALKEIYENVKPVMHLFFLERFVSPQEWHKARQGYARSTAVNAIVGYIVGLGDRHPNNILFDERTGELINIDFGIAFERGKNLQMPEMVPFRLTRDIVAGLGCLGTCGLFRRCAEAAMALLRQNGSLVTAVVEVFVHDPIYAWSCLTPKNVQREAGEAGNQSGQGVRDFSEEDGNDFARRAVVVVKDKLLGGSGHLGVSAHVQQLIYDASDLSQLCKMFNGWQQWV